MKERRKYYCSAVIGEQLVQDNLLAYSDRQAWYLFAKRHGFAMRDFKALPLEIPREVI